MTTSGVRVGYLDVAKAVGLGLVCFCHIPFPEGAFHRWVYSFHMPLFFILSGVFFSVERFGVGRSVRQLLVPFVFFNVLACGVSLLVGALTAGEVHLPRLDAGRLLVSDYVIGPSWFLVSLFLIRLFCGLVLRYLGDVALIGGTAGLLGVFYLTEDGAVWDAFSLGSTVLGLPFYVLGYYSRRVWTSEAHMGRWWLPLVALGLSVPAVYNGQVGLHAHSYGENLLLCLVFGVAGSVALVAFSRYVRLPGRPLVVLMDGALFFICMHTLIFEYSILVWNKLTDDFSGNTVGEKIVFTALTFVVSYPVILLMLRYMPWALGKKAGAKTPAGAAAGKGGGK